MNNIIEIKGKQYVDVKTAAEAWGVTTDTVCSYCRSKKIPNTIRNKNNQWLIPINAIKPLKEYQIKKLLVLVLQLKKDPNLEIDWDAIGLSENTLFEAYKYLEYWGYIKYFEKDEHTQDIEIPYIVELTEKGGKLIGKQIQSKRRNAYDWVGFLVKITPDVLAISKLILDLIAKKGG